MQSDRRHATSTASKPHAARVSGKASACQSEVGRNNLARCTILRIAASSVIRAVSAISPSPKLGNAFPITACNRCSCSTWSTGCCTPDTSNASPGSVRFATCSRPFIAVRSRSQALASAIFGLYTGLVYLTPIGGGLIADRLLGRTRTITIGALLMAAGHFLMAFDVTFLVALACLLTGVGCFKGNLASQVGALYATGDNRRADAFQIYYLFINGGVIAAPLIAGTLGESLRLALGLRRRGRRHADRSDDLSCPAGNGSRPIRPWGKRRVSAPRKFP